MARGGDCSLPAEADAAVAAAKGPAALLLRGSSWRRRVVNVRLVVQSSEVSLATRIRPTAVHLPLSNDASSF